MVSSALLHLLPQFISLRETMNHLVHVLTITDTMTPWWRKNIPSLLLTLLLAPCTTQQSSLNWISVTHAIWYVLKRVVSGKPLSTSISDFWILSHAFWTHKCSSSFSVPHTVNDRARDMLNRVVFVYLDILILSSQRTWCSCQASVEKLKMWLHVDGASFLGFVT